MGLAAAVAGDSSGIQPATEQIVLKSGVFWVVTPCGSCKN
jgi:hypothetical protein